MSNNSEIVLRFEEEFKNRANLGVVEEVMSDDFRHHAPTPGIPAGRDGVKAIGEMVFGAIADIRVEVDLMVSEDDLIADRITARGRLKSSGEPLEWTENHIYRLEEGKIVEWWPEGGPDLG